MSKKKQVEIRVEGSKGDYSIWVKFPIKVMGHPIDFCVACYPSKLHASNLVDRLEAEFVDCRVVWQGE